MSAHRQLATLGTRLGEDVSGGVRIQVKGGSSAC